MYIEVGLAVLAGFLTVLGATRCLGYKLVRSPRVVVPTGKDLKRIQKFVEIHNSSPCTASKIHPDDFDKIISTLSLMESSVGACCKDSITTLIRSARRHREGVCRGEQLGRLLDTMCIKEMFGAPKYVPSIEDFLTIHASGECVAAPESMTLSPSILAQVGPKTAESLNAMLADHKGKCGCEWNGQYVSLSELALEGPYPQEDDWTFPSRLLAMKSPNSGSAVTVSPGGMLLSTEDPPRSTDWVGISAPEGVHVDRTNRLIWANGVSIANEFRQKNETGPVDDEIRTSAQVNDPSPGL